MGDERARPATGRRADLRRVDLRLDGRVAVIAIDNPPVNALSGAVIADLAAAFDAFEAEAQAVGLVICCEGRTFVAGGDIALFDDPTFSPRPFNALLARIEASRRPVVAALFGSVLGGGLELALACHGRVASPGTNFGLPEVTLGLIPGSLGTQRLPRLIGLEAAAAMISTGVPIDARAALAGGLVDALAPAEGLIAAAQARLHALAEGGMPRLSEFSPRAAAAAETLAGLDAAAAERPYEPVRAAIAETLRAASSRSFAAGAAVEAEWFSRLVPSAPARAQRHLFFAEREAGRPPGLAPDLRPRPVERVGVLGAGTMGSGIALTFALAGYGVTVVEADAEALDRGLRRVEETIAALRRRGRLSEEAAGACRARIAGAVGIASLGEADLVVEAVFESMALKRAVAEELGRVCRPGAILATNTSTLDVDAIAGASGRPGDVIGTHFFSPVHAMRLLEVVRGAGTSDDVLATVVQLARRIGKTVVVSGVCYGFIGNRMAEVYMRESEAMQLEGVDPARIDGVIEDPAWLGLAMGPSRMLDMAGVDVGARTVVEWMATPAGPRDPAYRALCRRMLETGSHGQKTGHGYYRYEGRRPVPNPDHAERCVQLARSHGVAQRPDLSDREIFERLFFPMVNEAARILEEGIAYRGADIDVVWTAGYGFPRWRGGPLFFADELGLAGIVERLDHYAAAGGDPWGYWQVAPLLRRLAGEGARISTWKARDAA